MKTPPNNQVLSQRLDSLLTQFGQDRSRVLKGGDPEALHDFRVSLRRLRTCLRLLENRFPPRKLKPILAFLKQLTTDTNVLRDQEVLCATWRSLPPPAKPSMDWQQWLATQEHRLLEEEKETRVLFISPDFARNFSALKKTLDLPNHRADLEQMTDAAFKKERRKLGKALQKFIDRPQGGPLLHKLRVQAKRVRYCLDEFDFLMPREGRKLEADCKKTQDALGEWRDLDQALRILGQDKTGGFPENHSWLKELKVRKAKSWKRCLEKTRFLQKFLG